MVAPDVRKRAFGAFVTRATDHAKVARGWSIPRIAEESKKQDPEGKGISANTIYRWKRGQWTSAPDPEAIEIFCDTLDIPTSAPFVILWPGKTGKAHVPDPLPSDPNFDLLQRKVNDPTTSERDRWHILETIRTLALRSK